DDAPRDQVCHTLTHVVFGKDHVVGTELFQDATVSTARGPGPDRGDLRVDQKGGGQDAFLQVVADRHDGTGELGGADLVEHRLVGGIAHDGVGECVGVGLYPPGLGVHRQDLPAVVHQFQGQGTAETVQSDDEDAFVGLPAHALEHGSALRV